MSNLLYFYGMCGVVKELLLKRYFSKVYPCFNFSQTIFVFLVVEWLDFKYWSQDVRGNAQVLESDIVQACRRVSPLAFPTFHYLFFSLSFSLIKKKIDCGGQRLSTYLISLSFFSFNSLWRRGRVQMFGGFLKQLMGKPCS